MGCDYEMSASELKAWEEQRASIRRWLDAGFTFTYNPREVWSCGKCGALTINPDQHIKWHKEVS